MLRNICRLLDTLLYCSLGLHHNGFVACIICSMMLCIIDNFCLNTSFCLSYSFLFLPNFRLVKSLEIYMIMWLHVFLQGLLCVSLSCKLLLFSKILQQSVANWFKSLLMGCKFITIVICMRVLVLNLVICIYIFLFLFCQVKDKPK